MEVWENIYISSHIYMWMKNTYQQWKGHSQTWTALVLIPWSQIIGAIRDGKAVCNLWQVKGFRMVPRGALEQSQDLELREMFLVVPIKCVLSRSTGLYFWLAVSLPNALFPFQTVAFLDFLLVQRFLLHPLPKPHHFITWPETMIHICMDKHGARCNINIYLWHLEYADLKQRIAQRSQVSRNKKHSGEKEMHGNIIHTHTQNKVDYQQ